MPHVAELSQTCTCARLLHADESGAMVALAPPYEQRFVLCKNLLLRVKTPGNEEEGEQARALLAASWEDSPQGKGGAHAQLIKTLPQTLGDGAAVVAICSGMSAGSAREDVDHGAHEEEDEDGKGVWEDWQAEGADEGDDEATTSLFDGTVLLSVEAALEHDAEKHGLDLRKLRVEVCILFARCLSSEVHCRADVGLSKSKSKSISPRLQGAALQVTHPAAPPYKLCCRVQGTYAYCNGCACRPAWTTTA